MDYFTKWPEVFATSDQTAETVARLLVEHVIARHGAPELLLSDRGPNFLSALVQEVCKLVGTTKLNTSGYGFAQILLNLVLTTAAWALNLLQALNQSALQYAPIKMPLMFLHCIPQGPETKNDGTSHELSLSLHPWIGSHAHMSIAN